jgi:hypothetical protein
MQIDTRFLTVHPATAAWWDRRDRCESCRHLLVTRHYEGERIMRCSAAKQGGPNGAQYCIDARSEEGICRPEARRWEPVSG